MLGLGQESNKLGRAVVGAVVVGLTTVTLVACGTAAMGGRGTGTGQPTGPEDTVDPFGAFSAQEAVGWTAETCTASAERFSQLAAARTTQRTVSENRGSAQAWYMAGMSHQRCSRAVPAREAYQAALQNDDQFCEAWVGLGLSYTATEDLDAARVAFDRSVHTSSPCAEGYLNLGILERESGELDDAERNLRRALSLDTNLVSALNELALVQLARAPGNIGALDVAEVLCRQAQMVDPSYAPIHNTWGVTNLQQGRITEALRQFERASELDPGLFEAWMNFAQVVLSFRGYEDAERAFSQALSLNPRNYDALLGHGAALRGLGQREEAGSRFLDAQLVDPDRPEAWFNLGVLHQEHSAGTPEDLRQARRYFNEFLTKAEADGPFSEAVESVRGSCSGRTRPCSPGRLSQIEESLQFLMARPVSP